MNNYDQHCLICLEKLKPGQQIALENRSFACMQTFRTLYETVLTISTFRQGPQAICNLCSKELVKAYQFLEKCLNSRKVLELTIANNSTNTVSNIGTEYFAKDPYQLACNETQAAQEYFRASRALPVAEEKYRPLKKPKIEPNYVTFESGEHFCIEAVESVGNECEVETSQDHYQVIDYDPKDEAQWPVEALDENFLTTVGDANIQMAGTDAEYKCKSCNFFSNTARQYLLHTELKHGQSSYIECCLCSGKFSLFSRFKTHFSRCPKRRRSYTGVWKCPMCHDIVYNLHSHIEVEHKESYLYECDLCHKRMSSYYQIHNHMQHVHLGLNRCRRCNLNFTRNYELEKHNNTMHPKQYCCNVCSFVTSRKTSFDFHMKRHLGLKDVICEKCSKAFVLKRDLAKHMQTHGEENRFQCDQCPKAFKTRHILNKHRAYHREPQYECPVCHKMYRQLPTMRQHATKEHPHYQLPPKGTVMAKSWLEEASKNDISFQLYMGNVGGNILMESVRGTMIKDESRLSI